MVWGVVNEEEEERTTEENEGNEEAGTERSGYRIVGEPLMGFANGRNLGGVRWLIASVEAVVGAR